MSARKRWFAVALTLASALPPPALASGYDAHPKIVVILVIDQFRADYLERYRADFKARGFRLLLDKGAYFPDCYYGYANTKTAPGHATIGSGAYTDGHGIGSNEWWDLSRNKERPVSSVEDERYAIVGLAPSTSMTAAGSTANAPTATPAVEPGPGTASASAAAVPQTPGTAPKPTSGSSPRNLLASTVGDELRLATGGASQVWGVSLKDRAAILPAGSAANGAFWIDATTGRFVTSTYYMTALPTWAAAFDDGPAIATAEAAAQLTPPVESFYRQVGRTAAANAYELAFAEALIAGEQLGKHPTTDLVTISLSANDILGHRVGPDSPEEHAMVDALDTDLDGFFTWLEKNVDGGLGNVWIALTADHGIAPTPAVSSGLGLPGSYWDLKALTAALNEAINQKFSPGENQPYMLPQQELPYLALNEPVFARAGINEQEAENAVQAALDAAVAKLGPPSAPAAKGDAAAAPAAPAPPPDAATPAKPGDAPAPAVKRLPPEPRVFRSYTRQEIVSGELPATEFGRLLAHSYTPNGGWYVMVMPVAYQMESSAGNGTTHFSPYSYDRHVPLGFFGAPFAPGFYHGRVEPVDLAATFASLLGVNQPSASVGRVLTQALKPAAQVVYPKEAPPPGKPKVRRRRGRASAEAPGGGAPDAAAPVVPSAPAAAAPEPASGPATPTKAPKP